MEERRRKKGHLFLLWSKQLWVVHWFVLPSSQAYHPVTTILKNKLYSVGLLSLEKSCFPTNIILKLYSSLYSGAESNGSLVKPLRIVGVIAV